MINVPEIKAYMGRKSITNKELAKQIGTSPATLTRWFEKKDMPTSAAEKIAVALDIPADIATQLFFAPGVA